jgi:VCBS repeat protein/flagellar hook capping protein FlgD
MRQRSSLGQPLLVSAFIVGLSLLSWATPKWAIGFGACDFAFAGPTGLGVGLVPCSMAVADFDQDGATDIVTGNCSSSDISILFGLGDGQFEPELRLSLGARPGDIAIGDFDGDGQKDVIVACVELAHLTAFWGQGGRSLSSPTNIATPVGPFEIRMADVDEDGRKDLVILTSFVQGASVIWGDGTRDPASNATFPLQFNPSMLEVGDMDLDGELDFVVTGCSNDSNLYALFGAGNRQFSTQTPVLALPGLKPCVLRLGDLNGDQFLDVALAGSESLDGWVALGYGGSNRAMTLADTVRVGLFPTDVAIADFDGDGVGDVAVVDNASDNLLLLHGGTFDSAGAHGTGDCPALIAAADFNGDPTEDLAVMNSCSQSVWVYENILSVYAGFAQFVPSAYQIRTPGRQLSAELLLPVEVNPDLDPGQIDLVWRAQRLGQATSVLITDSLLGKVTVLYDRKLLDALEPGLQSLSVQGCDRLGSRFRADSSLTVLPARPQTLWQASLPGSVPVLLRIPDQDWPEVVLRVYTAVGRLVRTQRTKVGPDNLIEWDGRSSSGFRLPSGTYVATVEGGSGKASCKIILLR